MKIPTLSAACSALLWAAAFAENSTPSITAMALRALDTSNNSSSYSNKCIINAPLCRYDGMLVMGLLVCMVLLGNKIGERMLKASSERYTAQLNATIPFQYEALARADASPLPEEEQERKTLSPSQTE